MPSQQLSILVGFLLMAQLGGMILANFVSIMDWLMGVRWLGPVGLRPRVRWSLPFFIGLWLFSMLCQNLVYSAAGSLPIFAGEGNSSLRAIATITLCNGSFLLLIPVVIGPGMSAGLKKLGLSGPDLNRQLRMGVRMAWLVSPYVYAINLIANFIFEQEVHEVMKMLEGQLNPMTIFLSATTAVVLAPMVEEMMFRGVLLGALIRKTSMMPAHRRRFFVQAANVAASFFFAVLHFSAWPSPIGIFVLSLALGKLYIATGRLWPCVAAHAAFNLTGILGMIAAVQLKEAQQLAFLLP